jgi:death-on-curing protein
MPDFNARYPGKLESCLEMPFAKFGGVHFHRGVLKKAIAYLYYCTKDHPFENGNKRFAVVIMLYFLA